ncbi:hypothetical protein Aperf_G00000081076 [Anoplocephala perfoliata]
MLGAEQITANNSNYVNFKRAAENPVQKGRSKSSTTRSGVVTLGLTPDPTAARDLDNASPETQELCGRFPVHYCTFVYIPSSEVDDELYPFFRKDCYEMVKNSEMNDDVRKRLMKCAEVNGALQDRRLNAIEAQTQCTVHLGKLHGTSSVIRGLPRRRLTIAGPSFNHISQALQMMENFFPRLMQYAAYPYRFPQECDHLKYQSNRTFSCHSQKARPRTSGATILTSQIDDHSAWRKFICLK